ncbi:hypothetical protein V6N13_130161 [Hibiscus sabdariffa]
MPTKVDFCLDQVNKLIGNYTGLQGFSIFNIVGGGTNSSILLDNAKILFVTPQGRFKFFDPCILICNTKIVITVSLGTIALKLEDGTSQQSASDMHSSLMHDFFVSCFENLKKIPYLEHFQNIIFSFALVLAKFKREEKLKNLMGGIEDGKFKKAKVSFMNLYFVLVFY